MNGAPSAVEHTRCRRKVIANNVCAVRFNIAIVYFSQIHFACVDMVERSAREGFSGRASIAPMNMVKLNLGHFFPLTFRLFRIFFIYYYNLPKHECAHGSDGGGERRRHTPNWHEYLKWISKLCLHHPSTAYQCGRTTHWTFQSHSHTQRTPKHSLLATCNYRRFFFSDEKEIGRVNEQRKSLRPPCAMCPAQPSSNRHLHLVRPRFAIDDKRNRMNSSPANRCQRSVRTHHWVPLARKCRNYFWPKCCCCCLRSVDSVFWLFVHRFMPFARTMLYAKIQRNSN